MVPGLSFNGIPFSVLGSTDYLFLSRVFPLLAQRPVWRGGYTLSWLTLMRWIQQAIWSALAHVMWALHRRVTVALCATQCHGRVKQFSLWSTTSVWYLPKRNSLEPSFKSRGPITDAINRESSPRVAPRLASVHSFLLGTQDAELVPAVAFRLCNLCTSLDTLRLLLFIVISCSIVLYTVLFWMFNAI